MAVQISSVLSACQAPGAVNGQCVKYYGAAGCNFPLLGQFGPTCDGDCFRFDSFMSVRVAGDGTHGTDCTLYADINCTDEISNTGNVVSVGGGTRCTNAGEGGVARSMKCFFNC
jgi:hypothetical protein